MPAGIRIDIPHFQWRELVCRCCSRVVIDERFWRHMLRLENLRSWWGAPFKVTSGHRCTAHNKNVGGADNSQHLHFATDVSPALNSHRLAPLQVVGGDTDDELLKRAVERLAAQAEQMGFTGVGTYDTFVHLDLRGFPVQQRVVRWSG